MDDLIKWRRDLHKIPEEGLKEYLTTKYIEEELTKIGYSPQKLLTTGVYVYIDNQKDSTLAFRADIDAIQITEKNDIDYKSTHCGYMHACGHDGHTATLLGFAKKIKKSTEEFKHNILLIFQPGEESPGAAKDVVESKILEKYNVVSIFGQHLMPNISEGVIASTSGPLMATCGELDIEIIGKSAHAGVYNEGIDSIVIASNLIIQYQNIISRYRSPFDSSVLNIGCINGGSARNIVANNAVLKGTIRSFSDESYNSITNQIKSINKGLEIAYNCKINCKCDQMYPVVYNDEELYNKFESIMDTNYIKIDKPLMLSEDFSYYQEKVPGIFFFAGTKSDKYSEGLHTEKFNFDEKVLEKAVNIFYEILTKI